MIRAGALETAWRERLAALEAGRFAERLWARDVTLWGDGNTPELADRLGWLDLPDAMAPGIGELGRLAEEILGDGLRHVVLLGMGGSSLAPEVFARTLPRRAEAAALEVLDTTHPGAVRAATESLDPEATLFLVASKSGGTVETLSLFRHFWAWLEGRVADPGRHVVAITDPGTALEALGETRRFRAVVTAPPDVGGRFSALSVFGMVPAALLGADLAALLGHARVAAGRCRAPGADNPALALGALLGEAALAGRDKLTFVTSPGLAAFPAWLEQLLAESTGKDGRGIVPVPRELRLEPDALGEDRVLAVLVLEDEAGRVPREALEAAADRGCPVIERRLPGPEHLGAEMFVWEAATAVAGSILGVQPFDQPDVQLAKELARKALAGELEAAGEGTAWDDPALGPRLAAALEAAGTRGYVAIQAFLAPSEAAGAALARLEAALRARGTAPVITGYGPRYLHSTGQLHKGGPAGGVFLQLVDTPGTDLPIPETGTTFGRLIRAQADGDLAALTDRGRTVLRVGLGPDPVRALERLVAAVS